MSKETPTFTANWLFRCLKSLSLSLYFAIGNCISVNKPKPFSKKYLAPRCPPKFLRPKFRPGYTSIFEGKSNTFPRLALNLAFTSNLSPNSGFTPAISFTPSR